MSARLKALLDMRTEPYYAKLTRQLGAEEQDQMRAFIEQNDILGHLEFERMANRGVEGPLILNARKKAMMWELVTAANSRVHIRSRSAG